MVRGRLEPFAFKKPVPPRGLFAFPGHFGTGPQTVWDSNTPGLKLSGAV